jgi:hypothetical protein
MNRKILALIIILVVIGVYGLFYVAVTSVLMPMELNSFKSELNAMPQLPVNNNSTINGMENSASDIDSYPSLMSMSQSQRTEMANQMRNSNSPPSGYLNQNFTDYNTFYAISALAYQLTGKGTIATEINNLTTITNNLSSLNNESTTLDQKSANDFENGDDKAYADDLRNTANNLKQYNNAMNDQKTQLQNIINQLSG